MASGWDIPNEAEFRADERARRRWWAENYPADRGQPPPRCRHLWLGECPRDAGGIHECARPRGHPAMCMCYCGTCAREHGAMQPAPLPAAAEQEAMF